MIRTSCTAWLAVASRQLRRSILLAVLPSLLAAQNPAAKSCQVSVPDSLSTSLYLFVEPELPFDVALSLKLTAAQQAELAFVVERFKDFVQLPHALPFDTPSSFSDFDFLPASVGSNRYNGIRSISSSVLFGVPDQASPEPARLPGHSNSAVLDSAMLVAARAMLDDPGGRLPNLRQFSTLRVTAIIEAVGRKGVRSRQPLANVAIPFANITDVVVDGHNILPAYPKSMLEEGNEGIVHLQYDVTPQGRVDIESVKVVRYENSDFLHAVRERMRAWRFTPAMADGCPFRKEVTQSFSFQIEK